MSRRRWPSHPSLALKLLFLLRIYRGAALATLLGVLVCPQISCLIPQDINASTPGPHGNVPVFLSESFPDYLLPPTLSLTRQGSVDAAMTPPCHCELQFDQLKLEENPDIALEVRWYVDYDPSVPASTPFKRKDKIDATFNDPTQTTRVVPTYKFDADGAGIVTSGIHIVEVVVAEVGGFNDTSPTLPFRGMNEGFTSAVYRFAVNVTVEQVLGQCPRTLPSHVVCQ